MEEPFQLPVSYKGHDHSYEAQLHLRGYTYQIRVTVEGTDIYYERDEEGAFRAVLANDAAEKEIQKIDRELLEAIMQQLEALLA